MPKRLAVTTASLCLAASLAAAGSAAQSASGEAEKVSQSAAASGASGARVLEVRGAVFMGDEIRTNAAGEAQIRFVDNTRFVVGPNARVEIDKFVFAGGTARTVTIDAVRGAFRFITGTSPKRAYLIRTPVMTIGVRGTGLDGFVEAGTGRTAVALYEGAAEACDASGQCVQLTGPCSIVVAPPGGGFQDLPGGSRALFLPYSVSQASLLPDFRLDTSACGGATPGFREPTRGRSDAERGPRGSGDSGDGGNNSD